MPVKIVYDPEEFAKIREDFPNLYYDDKKNYIIGELDFCSRYIPQGAQWCIERCSHTAKGAISATYEIKIDFNIENGYGCPVVFETTGRIEKLAELRNRNYYDLHLNKDEKRSCCLGIFTYIDCLSLSEFVIGRVYPYFMWQGYYEKHNEVPPCGEYPHDILAALQAYFDDGGRNPDLLRKSLVLSRKTLSRLRARQKSSNKNRPCYCDSKIKYKRCCYSRDRRKYSEIRAQIKPVEHYLQKMQSTNAK